MFLRASNRRKDGKLHRYWSIVESVRSPGSRHPHQRTVLYLGELNDSQREAWVSAIEVFNTQDNTSQTVALFPSDRTPPSSLSASAISLNLSQYSLSNARQFGACWLGCELWKQLQLDTFWEDKLDPSREGTQWAKLLQVSTVYRLVEPGSEWRCHHTWFDQSAMRDLLGPDFGWGGKDLLYEVLDRLLEHREALFQHLKERWMDLFAAKFEVLLYDLTSTYFEGEAEEIPKAKRGYSRDHRPDCKQVVIALVITPEGFPLSYEVLDGNTRDTSTLPQVIETIERRYGKAERIWIMDRGIPTEKYLRALRGMRQAGTRDQLLMRIGAAKAKAGRAASFVELKIPKEKEAINGQTFTFQLKKEKLKEAELYDGHYLLRTNLTQNDPGWLWKLYTLLTQIEAVFRSFKNDLKIRPIYHSVERRMEAHIFVCFQAYCLYVLMQKRLAALAPGLTVRQALDRLSNVQMIDIQIPTTDGRVLEMSRYT